VVGLLYLCYDVSRTTPQKPASLTHLGGAGLERGGSLSLRLSLRA
jgi:hypothetical protein